MLWIMSPKEFRRQFRSFASRILPVPGWVHHTRHSGGSRASLLHLTPPPWGKLVGRQGMGGTAFSLRWTPAFCPA